MPGRRVKTALVFALAIGCGGSKPVQQPEPAPVAVEPAAPVEKSPEPANEAELAATQDAQVVKFEGFADQACQCKAGDTECAKKVSDDMSTWVESQPPDAPPIKPDARIQAAAERLSKCIATAITVTEPAPTPPEPAPAKAKPKKKAGAK